MLPPSNHKAYKAAYSHNSIMETRKPVKQGKTWPETPSHLTLDPTLIQHNPPIQDKRPISTLLPPLAGFTSRTRHDRATTYTSKPAEQGKTDARILVQDGAVSKVYKVPWR